MNDIQNDFISGIGNTPLIKLRAASEITGCNIFGKAEFLNPGGSVKDRAALALIKDAQEKKLIAKGGTVVEGTAGNTGISSSDLFPEGAAFEWNSLIFIEKTGDNVVLKGRSMMVDEDGDKFFNIVRRNDGTTEQGGAGRVIFTEGTGKYNKVKMKCIYDVFFHDTGTGGLPLNCKYVAKK